jgi:predicted Zn finger-like uncharacterized protein
MLIVCPTCATSYMIEPASLGPAGRTVRCTRCKALWFAGGPQTAVAGFVADVIAEAEAQEPAPAKRAAASPDDFGEEPAHPAAETQDQAPSHETSPPPEALPAGEAPPLVPPMPDPPAATTAPEDVETFVARRARMHVRRKEKRKSSKWTAIILVLLGFNVALVGARNEVVRYLPQTASLFAAIGLPVNLRHLTFENVKIAKDEHDGVPVLTVEGTIASQSGRPVEVPRLRFAVRNATGQEIYAWTARPTRSILGPGETLPFHSRLASPPADASDVLVRFVKESDIAAEKKGEADIKHR